VEGKTIQFFYTRDTIDQTGRFQVPTGQKIQTITINHDLNPYQFLITYIHEVAHYRAFETMV
jgi:hypothetical protein